MAGEDVLVVFGRVSFAFYVAHFFPIHLWSAQLGVIQHFSVHQLMTTDRFYPKGYGIGLPEVYAVWALVVIILYPLCG